MYRCWTLLMRAATTTRSTGRWSVATWPCRGADGSGREARDDRHHRDRLPRRVQGTWSRRQSQGLLDAVPVLGLERPAPPAVSAPSALACSIVCTLRIVPLRLRLCWVVRSLVHAGACPPRGSTSTVDRSGVRIALESRPLTALSSSASCRVRPPLRRLRAGRHLRSRALVRRIAVLASSAVS